MYQINPSNLCWCLPNYSRRLSANGLASLSQF